MSDTELAAVYAPFHMREDIVRAHEHIWSSLARPGTWLTGAERVAVAAETRAAPTCVLCQQRKSALSPYSGAGTHDAGSTLHPARVDAIHRIVTDPARLSQRLVADLAESGVGDAEYVELLSVLLFTLAIDTFHRALGAPLLPLPQPQVGEPRRERPAQLEDIGAWLPVLSTRSPLARDLYARAVRISNIARGLSLVPEATRDQIQLTQALYVPLSHIASTAVKGRALTRPQIELLAGRVSALNQCFY